MSETTGADRIACRRITARGHMRFSQRKGWGESQKAVISQHFQESMAGAKVDFLDRAIAARSHRPADKNKTRAFVDSQHGNCGCFFCRPIRPTAIQTNWSGKHLKADTVGRMTITRQADFKVKVRVICANCKTDREKIRHSTKNHRSKCRLRVHFTDRN